MLGSEEFESVPETATLQEKAEALESMANDWKEYADQYSGAAYYYNEVTGENVWEKPEVMVKAEEAKKAWLGDDWEQLDSETGAKYFYNNKTDMSQWIVPTDEELAISRGEKQANEEKGGEEEEKHELTEKEQDEANRLADEAFYGEEEKAEDEVPTVLIDGVKVPTITPTEEDFVRDEAQVAERRRIWDRREMIAGETHAQRCRRLIKYRVKKCAGDEWDDLDLANLSAKRIPPKLYELSHSLVTLRLGGNSIREIPVDVKVLTALRVLDLSANQLDAIPSQIWYFSSLEELDLSGNKLKELPREVGNLTTLRDLNLWELGIENLTSLKTLRISCNAIEALPDEIGQVATLETFSASSNCLAALPGIRMRARIPPEFQCVR